MPRYGDNEPINPEKAAESAIQSSRAMLKTAGPTPGEEAIAYAVLAHAYATMGLAGHVAELKRIADDRMKEVSDFLDAIVTAIRTHNN